MTNLAILWQYKIDIVVILVILWFWRSGIIAIYSNWKFQKQKVSPLQLTDKEGQISTFSFEGKKTTVVFFTTQCVYCKSELANLKQWVEEKSIDAKNILAIGLDNDTSTVFKFAIEEKYPFDVYWKQLSSENPIWSIAGTPTIMLINESSELVWKTTGSRINLKSKLKRFFR